ncbi:putative membrane protein [Burkholderia pseudomallei MSHR7527]|nr:putative membrane protein [Burkholderia pseudomallei MSHR7527]KGX38784.1 putative membrane protein [Burkholderia pseudomallei MSHR3335]
MMQKRVISAAVPAVVLIEINGVIGTVDLSIPS